MRFTVVGFLVFYAFLHSQLPYHVTPFSDYCPNTSAKEP